MPKPGQKRIRPRNALLVLLAVLVVILAWYQGGERSLRPIEQDVPVPEGVL